MGAYFIPSVDSILLFQRSVFTTKHTADCVMTVTLCHGRNSMLSVTANDKHVVQSRQLWHWLCHCPGSSLKIISCEKVECLVPFKLVC